MISIIGHLESWFVELRSCRYWGAVGLTAVKARFLKFYLCQESSHWITGNNSVNCLFWHASFIWLISEKTVENAIKVHIWITMICLSFCRGNENHVLRKRQLIYFATHVCFCFFLTQHWPRETLGKCTASMLAHGMLKILVPKRLVGMQLSIWTVSSNMSNATDFFLMWGFRLKDVMATCTLSPQPWFVLGHQHYQGKCHQ